MSNQEILEKAIIKAIDGGWKPVKGLEVKKLYSVVGDEHAVSMAIEYQFEDRVIRDRAHMNTYRLLFNHDFAKALWGEEWHETYADDGTTSGDSFNWEHHLQQMVIAEDPIAYLGQNLPQA